jgi:hypothetical protein
MVNEPAICQLIQTRFNIFPPGWEADVRSPRWLEQRIDLFARYCVPSVQQQTHANFTWVIYCAPETSPSALARIRAFDHRIRITLLPDSHEERRQVPMPSEYVPPETPLLMPSTAVGPYVPDGTDLVISTRLDNDDALHRDALRRTRSIAASVLASGEVQHLYSPVIGFKLDVNQRQLFLTRAESGPFISLLERVAPGQRLIGVLSGNHTRMAERFPTTPDTSGPLWVQVVHGGNISNGIRRWDEPVPLTNLSGDFGFSP